MASSVETVKSDDGVFDQLIDFRSKMREKMEQSEETEKLSGMKPSERLLYKIRKAGFNLNQMEEILRTHGDQLVVSCAGSGKTTTLIFKIMYDLVSGYATRMVNGRNGEVRVAEKIWVGTFLSSGADELPASLRYWSGKLGVTDVTDAISFSTIHAEFLRALKAFGFSKPIISGTTNTSYLKEVVKNYHLVNSRGQAPNSKDMSSLEGALTYTRNRLDAKRYDRDIYDELGIGAPLVDAILRDWKAKRVENGFVDFDDLQELIYTEVYDKKNEKLAEFLADRYNFFYIDEFQDTSQVQYAVLRIYMKDYKQLFVIGDDDQTIYTWRGSDHEIITKKFIEDYMPKVNKLAINYRCPWNILKAIVPSIQLNKNRFDKPLESSKEGGTVRKLIGYSYIDMAEKLNDCIYADLKAKRSVAVLCRVNYDGLLPALMLDKLGKFQFSISGEGMTLDSYMGTMVLSIVKLFTEKSTPSVKRALNQLAWDSIGINKLVSVCKTNRVSFWDIDDKDLSYSCPSIAETLIRWKNIRNERGEVECLKVVLNDYRTKVYAKDNPFNLTMRGVITAVSAMLEYSNNTSVDDFLYDLESISERLKGRIKNERSFVKIATVHEFKGKEADSVYIWNDSADVYPVKGTEDGSDEYEEERRIHYIACTRAKELCTLVYLKDRAGDFVYEMDLEDAEEINGTKAISGYIKKGMEEERNLQMFVDGVKERLAEDGKNSGSGESRELENGTEDSGIIDGEIVDSVGFESNSKKINNIYVPDVENEFWEGFSDMFDGE